MGRTGTAPSPAVGARARRALAVVLASIALVLCGAVDVLPRTAPGGSPPATAGTAPGATRAASLEAPGSTLGVRAAGLAAVAAPTSPGGGLPPAAGPLVSPHLVADPQRRPPTPSRATAPAGSLTSRAPPGPAGT